MVKLLHHCRCCEKTVPQTTADYHKPTTANLGGHVPPPPQFTGDRLPHRAAAAAVPLFAAVLWALRKLILHTLLPRLLPQPTFAVLKYDSGVVGL